MNEMNDRCVSAVRSKELTQYKDIVIEVIKAMREPTEEMVAAGKPAGRACNLDDEEVLVCWQFMIDKALEE